MKEDLEALLNNFKSLSVEDQTAFIDFANTEREQQRAKGDETEPELNVGDLVVIVSKTATKHRNHIGKIKEFNKDSKHKNWVVTFKDGTTWSFARKSIVRFEESKLTSSTQRDQYEWFVRKEKKNVGTDANHTYKRKQKQHKHC